MGEIIVVPLEEELKESYLDYAMSVIVGRALPDVRDGLKPVQRRILYAMYEAGNDWNKPYKKSARIVGEVIGKYHPHGDMPVYEAIVRMAQDFTMRYPLIDGQGNFGSIDGDAPAAMRYTEVRLAKIAHELLADIEKETVEFVPNYDNTLKEPVVLPSKIPNLLINGASGIAVGMATNIPPHNISEVIDALLALLKNPEISIDELMNYIKGPDFPTGAYIVGIEGIRQAYTTGKGLIKIKAKYKLEREKEKTKIVFTEIPYQVSKAKIVERIAQLAKEKKIEGISEVRDESDREGIRVVVELKKEWANAAHLIVKKLYETTPLETTFGVIMLALVNGKPEILNLKDLLQNFLNWRKTVIIRRTQHDLKKAKEKLHILEGYLKALSHLDEIIELIKKSQTPKEAKENLMEKFGFTEIQAQEILNLRLQRLTALEREKINLEYEELKRAISYYEKILTHEPTLITVIEEELKEIKEKYGDERKTEIVLSEEIEETDLEEKVFSEEIIVLISEEGYIRKIDPSQIRIQKRGGKGSIVFVGEERFTTGIQTFSHSVIWIFTEKGKIYPLDLKSLGIISKTSKGVHLKNFLPSFEGKVVFVVPAEKSGYLNLITRKGILKKIKVEELQNLRKSGSMVIGMKSGDSLCKGVITKGENNLLILTKKGISIHISEKDVVPTKKQAEGVIGIRLEEGDEVVDMLKTENKGFIFTVTERGFGKKTPVSDFRVQGKGGKGIVAHLVDEKTGFLVSGVFLEKDENLIIFASTGKAVKISSKEIPEQGRATKGIRVITLLPGEEVIGVLKVKVTSET